MWVWIVTGIMGFFFLLIVVLLIATLTGRRGYSLLRGTRPKKRRKYGSTYNLQRGGHQKKRQLNLRTGRLQRGSHPKKRPQINLD